MMFLDCPAHLDEDGTQRCGLPAEVRNWFTMRSTSGPIECVKIRCPSGHLFHAPLEFLTSSRPRPAGIPGGQTSGQDGRFVRLSPDAPTPAYRSS